MKGNFKSLCWSKFTAIHICRGMRIFLKRLIFLLSLVYRNRLLPTKKNCSNQGTRQLKQTSMYSRNCLNSHVPIWSIVCETHAFLLFIWLLHNGLFPTQLRSTICTPKLPLTAKAMLTDGHLNHLQKRLLYCLLLLGHICAEFTCRLSPNSNVNKVLGNSVYWWPHLLSVA